MAKPIQPRNALKGRRWPKDPTPTELARRAWKIRHRNMRLRRKLDYHRQDQRKPKVVTTTGFIFGHEIEDLQAST